jgi:hypothetical protein
MYHPCLATPGSVAYEKRSTAPAWPEREERSYESSANVPAV